MKRAAAMATALLLAGSTAYAQPRPPPGGGGGGGGGATQTSPTRNKNVGPQRGGGDDDQGAPPPTSLGEPSITAPQDPLAMPDGVGDRIGSDYDGKPPSPVGENHISLFPPQERKGDYRLRLIPPLYLEHTRGLDPTTGAETPSTDTERLWALMFYQRRSPKMDADILFPLMWRVRDRDNHVFVLGNIAHREAPFEHDNWLAPIVFEGSRSDGGYFHSPVLLTSSHWGEKGAFTIVGPYFRDRAASDVDWGIAPLVFHGDNGDIEGGNRRKYTLIPPLLYFHKDREIDESQMTIVGPVISQSDPKRSVLDVAPLWFSISGRPETGGVKEAHYTLFPLFHYGESPDQSLFVIPGYLRRKTKTADTLLTPFFSHATTRNGATSLTIAGPLLPVYYRNTDVDVGLSETGVFPFLFHSTSPTHSTFAIPLFARHENYNVSRTYWVFPTIVYERSVTGWETDIHPLLYVGREKQSSHTVLAPVFWDFASEKGRTTIGFPVYWRFADTVDGSLTQVSVNTLYREKPAVGGKAWEFHLLPLFSYGQSPAGAWWNVLFGLAGYDHDGPVTKIKTFWIPITVSDKTPKQAASAH